MRKTFVIAFLFTLFTGLATAQVPTSGNVFFGYSFYSSNMSSIDRSNMNGWEATVEGKVLPFVGIIGDFSGTFGSENFPVVCPEPCAANFNVSEHNYLFGPRVGVSVGKFRPFAEGMIGVAHGNAQSYASDTSFASALGGGIDYRLIRIVAWRVQGDYVHTSLFGGHQNNFRLSTGIVIRF